MPDTDLPSISHLSLESKRSLLVKLARELFEITPRRLSVNDGRGEVFLYEGPMSPREIAEAFARSRTIEERAELRRLALDVDNTFTVEEILNLPDELESSTKP